MLLPSLLCYTFKRNVYTFYSTHIYIYLLVVKYIHEKQYKEQCVPDSVLHLFTFICSPLNKCYFTKCSYFIKLCTHDFSRITFAAELSTNLVYNSIFVIDYDYIFFHLFFFKIKLSIFSRLCLTQKSDDQVNTLRYRNSTLIIKKKTVLYRIGRYS